MIKNFKVSQEKKKKVVTLIKLGADFTAETLQASWKQLTHVL